MRYILGFEVNGIISVEAQRETLPEANEYFTDRAEALPPEADKFVLARMVDGEAVIMRSSETMHLVQ